MFSATLSRLAFLEESDPSFSLAALTIPIGTIKHKRNKQTKKQ